MPSPPAPPPPPATPGPATHHGPRAEPPPVPGQPTPARLRANPLGLLLLLPAVAVLLLNYVWPTLRTSWLSTRANHRVGLEMDPVGFDNYRLLGREFFGTFGYALSFATIPLLILIVVAPLLAWVVHKAGQPGRWVARVAFAVPMVAITPAAFALAWPLQRGPLGLVAAGFPQAVRTVAWLTTFGLLVGLGLTVYLAVWRGGQRREPGTTPRFPWVAAVTVAAISAIAVLAVSLQTFTYPFILTRGGPGNLTTTPMLEIYSQMIFRFSLGQAAAGAMVLLLPLMALGLLVALLIIAARLRIEVDPRPAGNDGSGWGGAAAATIPGPGASANAGVSGADSGRPWAWIVTGLAVVAGLAVWGYGVWPWLVRLGRLGPLDGTSAVSIIATTWIPPLISAVIGVALAAVAGFGIGAMRPLGRWSELLLLPFAPWLFVSVGPLAVAHTELLFRDIIPASDTVLRYIPPVWLVIPALFLFTMLFRGLAESRHRRALAGADPGLGALLTPALPMLAVTVGAVWLVQSQSLLWGSLVSYEDPTGPVWVDRLNRLPIHPDTVGFGLVLPIPMIMVFAGALIVLQIIYLDRVAIRAGRTD